MSMIYHLCSLIAQRLPVPASSTPDAIDGSEGGRADEASLGSCVHSLLPCPSRLALAFALLIKNIINGFERMTGITHIGRRGGCKSAWQGRKLLNEVNRSSVIQGFRAKSWRSLQIDGNSPFLKLRSGEQRQDHDKSSFSAQW